MQPVKILMQSKQNVCVQYNIQCDLLEYGLHCFTFYNKKKQKLKKVHKCSIFESKFLYIASPWYIISKKDVPRRDIAHFTNAFLLYNFFLQN